MYKTDSKDSHFVYHFTEASRSFHWEGYLYKFTNLVQPPYIYKINENSNSSPTQNENPGHCVFVRHAFEVSSSGLNSNERRSINFSVAAHRVCI